jgi:hypothetical protein
MGDGDVRGFGELTASFFGGTTMHGDARRCTRHTTCNRWHVPTTCNVLHKRRT